MRLWEWECDNVTKSECLTICQHIQNRPPESRSISLPPPSRATDRSACLPLHPTLNFYVQLVLIARAQPNTASVFRHDPALVVPKKICTQKKDASPKRGRGAHLISIVYLKCHSSGASTRLRAVLDLIYIFLNPILITVYEVRVLSLESANPIRIGRVRVHSTPLHFDRMLWHAQRYTCDCMYDVYVLYEIWNVDRRYVKHRKLHRENQFRLLGLLCCVHFEVWRAHIVSIYACDRCATRCLGVIISLTLILSLTLCIRTYARIIVPPTATHLPH